MKNDTLKKLKSMRLPAFAEAYEKQIDQEAEYGSMAAEIGRASCRERV